MIPIALMISDLHSRQRLGPTLAIYDDPVSSSWAALCVLELIVQAEITLKGENPEETNPFALELNLNSCRDFRGWLIPELLHS